ncbi:MAG: hypothetical protein WBQ44_01890 [Rhodococcus sp. (in: high G+C Gram-positive bacteria)]
MPDGETLRITAETGISRGDGETPWIELGSVFDDDIVSTAVLDDYLYEGIEPAVGDDAALVDLGWQTPADWTARGQIVSRKMVRSRLDAADIARCVVEAFRTVWHVAHPAFLAADAVGGSGRQFRTAADRPRPDTTAVVPLDLDHLRVLVLHALGSGVGLGHAAEDNGDIAVHRFSLPLHVCFGHDASEVRLHVPVASGVESSPTLTRKLSWLHTRWRNITFVVAGGQLFAGITVDTRTFVPRTLTFLVYRLGLFVDRVYAVLASELGGTVFDPGHPHDDPLPKVTWSDDGGTLGTLRAACELTGGPVDTATVEALCRLQDVAELIERARMSAERFRDHAHRLGDERRLRAAVLCDTFAAAWDDVVVSLERSARPRPVVRCRQRAEQIGLFEVHDEPALFDARAATE